MDDTKGYLVRSVAHRKESKWRRDKMDGAENQYTGRCSRDAINSKSRFDRGREAAVAHFVLF